MSWVPRLVGLTLLTLACACAHGPKSTGAEGVKKTADLFHHRARWKDYGGAALIIVPEKRPTFDKARADLNDPRDLNIADYELLEIQLSPDALSARIVSRVSWHRLPSVTQHDDTVVSEFIWRDGAWLLARQTGGPFEEELSAPYVPPQDAGTL